ncbi:SusC/RagA family TonB-linked outer membrane protein [Hymenobacter sp. HMF4947]|uniref:SusC/RagA family TonB-linked outer membrane protein n=1 Tax=Hymenobacter ginkgonis TaxID=2682976 RepID=A0A7K1TEM4_9BACT|nr:TonB-dependent receptor [Hymenobacter ginkgonis]MVN76855.1 SusC/RagA family TonB-linked outer membrane protein [Hymenobacter ginkgonis]
MRNLFTPLLVMAALPAFAQTQAVTGHVIGSDGVPVPGATIVERGTTNGVTSNADGAFSLSVQPQATLVISSVGYTSQTVAVGSRRTIDVTLAASATDLAEAVVVGYGTQTKADLTGSVAQLSSKEVGNQPVQSFEQSIQGKAAGVFIESSSGKLGQGIRVRVRGVSSISGGTQPLYVVDGVPVVADNLSSTTATTNPIADINPNDIESISVLKDGSASAIYGSRATNGVVLITTKRGKAGATRFNFNVQGGYSEPTHKREFLNSQEYVTLLTESLVNRGTTFAVPANIASRLSGYAGGVSDPLTYNTDWQDQVLQKAGFQQYDFNTSGGTDKTRFYLSGQYSKQKGIIVSNQYERIASRFNIDHQATKWLSFGLNLTATRSVNNRVPNDNAFSTPMQIVALAPITPLIDPRSGQVSGALDPTTGLPNTGFPFYYNPLLSIQGGSYITTVYRLLGNVYAQAKLTEGLLFRSELGTDVLTQNEEQYLSRVTSRNTGNTNGYAYNAATNDVKLVLNNYFSYKKTFAEDHALDVTVGTSYESSTIKGNSVTGTQFASDAYRTIDNASQITAGTSYTTGYTLVSYFARASYAFAGKYLVGASSRIDGSSRFGIERRYGIFPAGSIGWLISEESFMKNNPTLSLLKVRGSIGKTGNAGFPNFASRSLWTGANAGYVGTPGQRPYQIGNDFLTWESTVQYDAGLEYGLFNNRISGEVDIYRKNTTGLLLAQPLPGTSGFSTYNANVGSLRNQGIEFTLTTRNLVGDFNWTTSVNASINRNKVLDLAGPDILGSFLNRAQAGQPLGVFVGPEYAGVDPANGNALYYLNSANADGTINRNTTTNINLAANVPIGNPNPTWTGGITNTFSFKGFDLTATLVGVFGNQIYDGGAPFFSSSFNNGFDNQTRDQLNRWQKPGDITNVPKAIYGGGNGTGQSSRFVQNGDYGRLRSVLLGYNLPSTLAKRAYLQSARIFVQGYNLLTFTKYTGWDPEVSADYVTGGTNGSSNNISQGISFYTAPQARTYTIGLNLGF